MNDTRGDAPTADEVLGRVHQLLYEAERIFGARDADWRFAGIIFEPRGPNIRFSATNEFDVYIALNQSCVSPIFYPDQLLFQLSHEIVHLLNPNRSPPTSMLEEGAAVWFSLNVPLYWGIEYVNENYARLMVERPNSNYSVALRAYESLIKIYPDAMRVLRADKFHLSNVTEIILSDYFPLIDVFTIRILCEHRVMRLSDDD